MNENSQGLAQRVRGLKSPLIWDQETEHSDEQNRSLIIKIDNSFTSNPRKGTISWFKMRIKSFIPAFLLPKESRIRLINLPGLCNDKQKKYVSNAVNNRKYGVFTFFPKIIYEQFHAFVNLYYLFLNFSQIFDILKIGLLYTYYGPLVFILLVKISTELYDELKIWKKDKELNSQLYKALTPEGTSTIKSSKIRVGNILVIEKGQRVPADMIILKNFDGPSCFIKTDQLDGETDWKMRISVAYTQNLPSNDELMSLEGFISAEAPKKDIYSFIGTMSISYGGEDLDESLSLENTLWHNTILASGQVIAVVIYTGKDTRASMNQSPSKTKFGVFDKEMNYFSKPLALMMVVISVLLVYLSSSKEWYLVIRFIVLFSSMIPMSMRVNLDLARLLYAIQLSRDTKVEGTIVRNSNIPEELGRIDYLLTDKTGTLTKNEMELKRLSSGIGSLEESSIYVIKEIVDREAQRHLRENSRKVGKRSKQIYNLILALSLCHSVTPAISDDAISYKSPSPDEIAIVEWGSKAGLQLCYRDLTSIHLKISDDSILKFSILDTFPFSSSLKRMGIVLRDLQTDEIIFLLKGADSVMSQIVINEDWLQEECDNMAREGLRTLVFAKKVIREEDYKAFSTNYQAARCLMTDRYAKMNKIVHRYLENQMEIVGVSGVEDKLQDNVRITIEYLRSANIKIWMLTGDKIETATCVATSSRLVNKDQNFYIVTNIESYGAAEAELKNLEGQTTSCLVIDGQSLQTFLEHFAVMFIKRAMLFPSAVFCRCSPTQKAQITNLIKKAGKKRVCAVGDGGNDVSMIKAAHYGIGLEGKEGNHAAFTADTSITRFSHLSLLILWFGRLHYKRSAKLIQLIIHKGLLISFIQIFFTLMFYTTSARLHDGLQQLFFTTIYTSIPAFLCVTDRDISHETALVYPELYRDLRKGRSLCWLTFTQWITKSLYQGGIILLLSIYTFETDLFRVGVLSFFASVVTELLTTAIEVIHWNKYMVIGYLLSLMVIVLSTFIFPTTFDFGYLITLGFHLKLLCISALSILPLVLVKLANKCINPPSYEKLR